jgi:hypothetical protein
MCRRRRSTQLAGPGPPAVRSAELALDLIQPRRVSLDARVESVESLSGRHFARGTTGYGVKNPVAVYWLPLAGPT